MGRYVQETMMTGEDLVYEADLSWVVFLKPALLTAVLCLIAALGIGDGAFLMWMLGLGAALLGIGGAVIRRMTTEVAVTNRRIILKTGLIKRETMEQFLEKIDSIAVDQGVIDRLANSGTITVRGSGQSSSPVSDIDHPLQFRKMVNEQIERIKTKA
ncbi:MAG: PH domain-containing protein [Alphaproteobacteria bacterium]